MVEGLRKGWLILRNKFCLVYFILGRANWCGVIILDEIVFFSKSDFNKKRKSYCVWHHLWLISHLLPYYRLKFTFTRLLTDCLMYPVENDNISKRVNIFLKLMLQMLQNLYLILFGPSLLHIDQMLKQLEKVFQWLPPT